MRILGSSDEHQKLGKSLIFIKMGEEGLHIWDIAF